MAEALNLPVLFDIKERKIGCVLLQAAFRGDSHLPSQIDTKHWFVAPTDNMKLYNMSVEQKKQLIDDFKGR